MKPEFHIIIQKKLYKQRNILIIIIMILLLSNCCLSVKIITMDNQTILVPGILQEFHVSNSSISFNYLEELTHMSISYLLDLSPSNVVFKKSIIHKYVIAELYNQFSLYFDEQIEQIQKFKLSTYFTIKETIIDSDNLSVQVTGILHTKFGKEGYEEKDIKCNFKYINFHGYLKIKDFKFEKLT